MNEQLDPQVLNLAKAIRRAETGSSTDPYNTKGASGEFGAYQFMPSTYKSLAKKHLGNEGAEPTIENQNKIVYSEIKALKDQGKNPAQIASIWNSGKENAYKENLKGTNKMGVKYDVPAYVAKVSQHYNELKKNSQPFPQESTKDSSVQTRSGAWFPASPTDSGLTAGLKGIGNLPQSAFNFGKGVLQTLNPINTIKNLAQIPGEVKATVKESGGVGKAAKYFLEALPQTLAESFLPQGVRQVTTGDVEGAAKTFVEDPFGQVAPLVLAGRGVARGADAFATKSSMAKFAENPYTKKTIPKPTTKYSNAFDSTISGLGGSVVRPLSAIASAPLSFASKVARSATSQLIGLEPESISRIISNPAEFSKIKQDQATRGNLASEFGKAVERVEQKLDDAGEGYNPIRADKKSVPIPQKFVDSVLEEFGLKVKKGKVVADSNSITRNTGDLRALQNFYDNWGNKKSVTGNEYLNFRKDVAGIAKFGKELGTNIDAQKVGTKLYERANQIIRPKIRGLKELDDQFSPQKKQFEQIKKDFLQKDSSGEYVFKDGAINKIANAANKGKDQLLARMEEVMPGITKKVEILKTVEDIQKAYGNKVGTYARGVIGGGGILTGNIAVIIASIIANPSIAVPLLRSLGYTASQISPIIDTLKIVAGDVNDLRLPMLGVKGIKSNRTKAKDNPIRSYLKPIVISQPTKSEPN